MLKNIAKLEIPMNSQSRSLKVVSFYMLDIVSY